MSINPIIRRISTSAALLACAAIASLAFAGETNETTISIDENGASETVTFNDLAVGESRAISTESGKAATIARNDNGLVLDLGNGPIELAMPDDSELAHAAHGQGTFVEKDVTIEKNSDGSEVKKHIVIKRRSHGEDGQNISEEDIDMIARSLEGQHGTTDGDKRKVIMIRKVTNDQDSAE